MGATKVSAKALRRLAVASALVVLEISLAATRGVGMRYLVLLHEIPGGDLLGHFFLFGTVSFLSGLASSGPRGRRSRNSGVAWSSG